MLLQFCLQQREVESKTASLQNPQNPQSEQAASLHVLLSLFSPRHVDTHSRRPEESVLRFSFMMGNTCFLASSCCTISALVSHCKQPHCVLLNHVLCGGISQLFQGAPSWARHTMRCGMKPCSLAPSTFLVAFKYGSHAER